MNKSNYINLFFILLGFCFTVHSVSGQSTVIEYFMRSSFTNTSLNPAKRPEKGYIGIPGLTDATFGYKTNTFNLDHFLFPGVGENGKAGWFLHENVSYDDFMKNISKNNYLDMDFNWTALGFGFYSGDLFLSFDASCRVQTNFNLPGDLFRFAKRGLALDENDEGTHYDFSDIGLNANAYMQIGLGASYPLLDQRLVLGAKIKILMGIAQARFNLDQVQINLDEDNWSIRSQASGQFLIPTVQAVYDENEVLKDFSTGHPLSAINGSGLGLDLGATFKPTDQLTLSAALMDIGYIAWNNKMTHVSNTTEEKTILGVNREPINLEETDDILKELQEYFDGAVALRKDNSGSRTTGLGAKLNWGAEYALMDNQLNIGFLTTTYFNSVKNVSEFTIAGAYRPTSIVELGLSYSFAYSRFQTVGFALHLGPGFYIASDYIIPRVNSSFIPTTSKAMNVQFGLIIPIGGKREK